MSNKACAKRERRIRMATRMRDFWLLLHWCQGGTAFVYYALFWQDQLNALIPKDSRPRASRALHRQLDRLHPQRP